MGPAGDRDEGPTQPMVDGRPVDGRPVDGHPVIDGHNGLPIAMRELVGYDLDAYDLVRRPNRTRTELVRLVEGGVRAQFW